MKIYSFKLLLLPRDKSPHYKMFLCVGGAGVEGIPSVKYIYEGVIIIITEQSCAIVSVQWSV